MNSITVPYLAEISYQDPSDVLTAIFPLPQLYQINYEPWPGGGVKPQTKFNIAYGYDAIFLKFWINEQHYRSVHTQDNEPVYEDSCVEFFIGFNDDEAYYNFEFNAGGTALAGWGKNRERELFDPSLVGKIRRFSGVSITDQPLPFSWELLIVIPFSVFSKHEITTLKSSNCRGNFYKCGDKLPDPHFFCWNNIVANQPNFHLSQYFGEIIFE